MKVAYYATARVVGAVPASVFVPAPHVDSVLVRLDRQPAPPVDVPAPERLFALVRAGFAQRRKMLRGALRPLLGERTDAALVEAGIAPSARAETLSPPRLGAARTGGGHGSVNELTQPGRLRRVRATDARQADADARRLRTA